MRSTTAAGLESDQNRSACLREGRGAVSGPRDILQRGVARARGVSSGDQGQGHDRDEHAGQTSARGVVDDPALGLFSAPQKHEHSWQPESPAQEQGGTVGCSARYPLAGPPGRVCQGHHKAPNRARAGRSRRRLPRGDDGRQLARRATRGRCLQRSAGGRARRPMLHVCNRLPVGRSTGASVRRRDAAPGTCQCVRDRLQHRPTPGHALGFAR
mmetsp:Transcript_59403/g.121693  ORF Transcript_59403/g.121693 Transcript_59403/m.121693 type:complete len:213 (+) Transcript_59403:1899-2537(+)